MPTCRSQVPDKRIHNVGICSKRSPICHYDIPPIDRGFHLLVEREYALNKAKLEIYTWFIYQNVSNREPCNNQRPRCNIAWLLATNHVQIQYSGFLLTLL